MLWHDRRPRVSIISLLPDRRWKAVVRTSPAGVIHQRVQSGAAFIEAVLRPDCTYAVADPELVRDIAFDVLVSATAELGRPLLLLGDLTPTAVRACLVAESIRPVNVLFADSGEMRGLSTLLREPSSVDVPGLLLHYAGSAISILPPAVRIPTVGLFTGGSIPFSTLALSERVGFNRRTVQRWYRRAGLVGAGRVLSVARLSRAWRLLRARRLSIQRVASLAGFGSTRTLSRACRRLAGCGPMDVREHTASAFAEQLAIALVASFTRTALSSGEALDA